MLFDCGRGAVIRLSEAGVNPSDIDSLFLTHLHSDHVVGIPDFWLTGWFLGRTRPLRVSRPAGTRSMAQRLVEAFSFDVGIRESTEDLPSEGAEIDAHDIIEEGKVYNDGSVQVSTFTVNHGCVRPALRYRVDYSGRSVVISGDTKLSQNLINFARGADCLVHVAWSVDANNPTSPSLRSLASAEDAARVFAFGPPSTRCRLPLQRRKGLADAIRAAHKGSFVVAKDLMTIEIGLTVIWKDVIRPGTGP